VAYIATYFFGSPDLVAYVHSIDNKRLKAANVNCITVLLSWLHCA